jgi:cyclopropane-fatty-acyl-phospholipid synthase
VSLLQDLLGSAQQRDFSVRLWDGTTWQPDPAARPPFRFTLVLRHPGALRSMFLPPNELNLFEAYIYDDFDVEGDVESLIAILDRYIDENGHMGKLDQLRFGKRLLSLPRTNQRRPSRPIVNLRGKRHSKERDRRAVSYHYDQSNDFYALFLDPYMLYSCAYFASDADDLNTAQERKIDYVCRKLRLRSGERLLDLGCGWGGLVMHAAHHYGVQAYGVTVSQQQAELAQRRIAEAGLEGHCRVEVRDYREVEGSESYDKVAAVGLLEHVGEAMLPDYYNVAWRLLRPGGVFLSHAIASPASVMALDDSNFFGRYVFPDGELLPIGLTLQAAEKCGFDVRDVESLRDHYTLTLRLWVRRLEEHSEEARALLGDFGYRIYRLYMAVSAHGFRSGRITIYQSLLSKPDHGQSGLPLTRTDWYD